jgi:alkanesulfonate monooxygenase SsuD/methylene tetrahydromethanopterin reductase-like flavin-dependent oxidoreductase (luciferase family)
VSPLPLAVGFGWHQHGFEDLRELVRHAEACGYAAAYLDGDVSVIPSLGEREQLDGWTVTTALLAATPRASRSPRSASCTTGTRRASRRRARRSSGSSRGARACSSRSAASRPTGASGSRCRGRASGSRGSTRPSPWCGGSGAARSLAGRFVTLAGAQVRPALAAPPPIEVGGRGPRLLAVAARHADAWNVNLPPLAARLAPARRALDEAFRARGRGGGSLALTCPVFTRPGADPRDPALLAAYRRFNPWFRAVPDVELAGAIVAGEPVECRRRLDALRKELGVALPIVDLTGLPRDAARRALDAVAPR